MEAPAPSERVWAAHADAWQQQARIRAGGAWEDLPGVRVMTSGLPHPQWNHADVTDSRTADIDLVRDWFRGRGVPWGARVPAGMPWTHGQHVLRQHLMAQTPDRLAPAAPVRGVTLSPAVPGDLDTVLRVDALAFDGDMEGSRPWMTPLLHHPSVTVAVAVDDDGPVGTGYLVRSDAAAGPAAYLGGVAVVPRARRRGIGAGISSWLLEQGYAAGAGIATLQPDTEQAARVYARLGFSDAGSFDVFVDTAPAPARADSAGET